jgi:hypothetical protein
VSAEQEEMMPEAEAARYLNVSKGRLRELAVLGELRMLLARGPDGEKTMYLRGQVLRLKARLAADEEASEAEEWPDVMNM